MAASAEEVGTSQKQSMPAPCMHKHIHPHPHPPPPPPAPTHTPTPTPIPTHPHPHPHPHTHRDQRQCTGAPWCIKAEKQQILVIAQQAYQTLLEPQDSVQAATVPGALRQH
eukprot:scaffold88099_cov18-Tisochrysis_lutea.AAC.1